MGRKAKKIDLTDAEKTELEIGFKQSKSKVFSQRCHYILLKHQGRTSKEIAEIYGTTDQPINSWCKRYRKKGMAGLQTKPGQGRKLILDKELDKAKVKAAVQKERQRIKMAKGELERGLGKKFSTSTLKRFLKKLAADGKGSA